MSSGDDIVFGEVRYREPVRMRRPDRDRRWACVAYEVPGPGDLPIFLDRGPADAIERHALRDTSVELGGILLGRECLDDQTGEPFVRVTVSLEAKHYENTQASFTYTHDSWEEITRERDRLHPDLDVVGWYHTHPDFGIFLSGHDLFIHRNFFDQPLQVAYVVDPIRQERGFFRWKDGGLDRVGGFYLAGARGERVALARLANDLESIPNADGGGGLSPRLEAELIAMLSRPGYQAPPAPDRAVAAVVGGLVGAIGLAAVLWINGVTQRLGDQAERFRALGDAVRDNTATQRMAVDALLKRAEPGAPTGLVEDYKKALADLDASRSRADGLGSLTARLETENKALRSKHAEAEGLAREHADEAKAAKALRLKLLDAEEQVERFKAMVATKTELLDEAGGEAKAAALVSKARWGVYLAVAGWVVAALLGVGLVLIRPHAGPTPPAEPPHVIA